MSFLHLKFSGWCQCRLATSPDPPDDPRGTRGLMRALPGEPDFDRIIRFQNTGQFKRTHSHPIGVKINEVFGPKGKLPSHPLIDAAVNLEGRPIFKGENGIVAGEASEPIVPFEISITGKSIRVSRSAHQELPQFPFTRLKPTMFNSDPGKVMEATGIYDYPGMLLLRINALQNELDTCSMSANAATMKRRINFLQALVAKHCENYFYMTLTYRIALTGIVACANTGHPNDINFDPNREWVVQFWVGGWDIDVACMYVCGYLDLPTI